MEESFLKSTLSMKVHHEDTSLALPTARTEPAQSDLRVQRQVQLKLRRNSKKDISNGGVNLQRNAPRSSDDTDGLFTNTKVNGYDISNLSLKDIHSQRVSRRLSRSPSPSIDLSQGRCHVAFGALMDYPVGSNSSQQYATSETSPGTATRASVSPHEVYRSKPLMPRMSGPTQLNRRFPWQAQTSQRQISYWHYINSMEVDTNRLEENLPSQKSVKKPPEMTLRRALDLLHQDDEEKLISAAQCIQTECFQDYKARFTVFIGNGVAKLLPLLNNDSEEVQRAAAGALRNVAYKSAENKTKVKDNNGLFVIEKTLENTRDKETILQLAGLLWNLSSDDTIKELFSLSLMYLITKVVLVPGCGMSAAENPKDEMIADPKAFYCATGCLRNLSSAGPNIRKSMRKCKNLIDSLVYYIRSTVDSREPDDESTEHCVCTLRNLTYEAELDLTSQNTEPQKESEQDTTPQKTARGFPHRCSKPTEGVKDMKYAEKGQLLQKEKDPHGAEWLWSDTVVRLYLSLMVCSKRSSTQQAAIGALQNLTVRNGQISEYVAFTIEKENGIQKMKMVFEVEDISLKEPAIFLTSSLSRYPDLCHTISKELLPDVVKMVHSLDTETNVSEEVTVQLFQILTNLSKNDVMVGLDIIEKKVLEKMLSIQHTGEAEKAANTLVYTMSKHIYLHKHLHKLSQLEGRSFKQNHTGK